YGQGIGIAAEDRNCRKVPGTRPLDLDGIAGSTGGGQASEIGLQFGCAAQSQRARHNKPAEIRASRTKRRHANEQRATGTEVSGADGQRADAVTRSDGAACIDRNASVDGTRTTQRTTVVDVYDAGGTERAVD